jgi:cyclic pyranopterin phosphate synthase
MKPAVTDKAIKGDAPGAHIVSINISGEKGIPKTPVSGARLVVDHGIEGDAHAGRWHRQISLLAQESIDKMSARGLEDLSPGVFAENITTRGLILYTLRPGIRLLLGECLAEVTQIGKECHQHCHIYRRAGFCVMPTEGIFVKVIRGGNIKTGDPVIVLGAEEPPP